MSSVASRTLLDASVGLVDLTALEDGPTLDSEAVAMAAHEILGALTPLQGWLGMLRTGALDGDRRARREAFAAMQRAAGRLERLTGDLLDLSALDRGALRFTAWRMDMASAAAEATEALARTSSARPLEVSVAEGLVAFADPFRVQQVLGNFLSNADRHAPPGTPVRVGANAVGSSVIVWVSNSGPSIDPEERSRLFRPFAQGKAATAGGHGLGLAISKRLVEAMGGRIGVVSAEGEGPSFFFTLPAEPPGKRAT